MLPRPAVKVRVRPAAPGTQDQSLRESGVPLQTHSPDGNARQPCDAQGPRAGHTRPRFSIRRYRPGSPPDVGLRPEEAGGSREGAKSKEGAKGSCCAAGRYSILAAPLVRTLRLKAAAPQAQHLCAFLPVAPLREPGRSAEATGHYPNLAITCGRSVVMRMPGAAAQTAATELTARCAVRPGVNAA